MILNIPNKIWQEDEQGKRRTQPDPRRAETAALPGQYQPNYDAEAEDQHGVLIQKANSRH